jgi:uncharacterized protein YjfI (DUF2170 family)
MATITKIAEGLSEICAQDNESSFDIQSIPGDVEVLQIRTEDRQEIPIYLTSTSDEILCMAYLFREDEIKKDKISEMQNIMLSMNVPMPLSSFAKVDQQYVVFGALSADSNIAEIAHEVETLSENSVEALDALQEYLA